MSSYRIDSFKDLYDNGAPVDSYFEDDLPLPEYVKTGETLFEASSDGDAITQLPKLVDTSYIYSKHKLVRIENGAEIEIFRSPASLGWD